MCQFKEDHFMSTFLRGVLVQMIKLMMGKFSLLYLLWFWGGGGVHSGLLNNCCSLLGPKNRGVLFLLQHNKVSAVGQIGTDHLEWKIKSQIEGG